MKLWNELNDNLAEQATGGKTIVLTVTETDSIPLDADISDLSLYKVPNPSSGFTLAFASGLDTGNDGYYDLVSLTFVKEVGKP